MRRAPAEFATILDAWDGDEEELPALTLVEGGA
jgi:hypothetical protein